MRIHVGYDMTLNFPQPTPMILTLSVHQSRAADLLVPDWMATEPVVGIRDYWDGYGNRCSRVVAPAGRFRVAAKGLINDSGAPDEFAPQARQVPVELLPDETLVYLLGSRYCETDLLYDIAWRHFGQTAPGWSRVQAICDFVHQRIQFGYPYARNTRTAFEAYHEQRGVCRDFAHLGVALCRCMNIPARYCAGYLGDIGVPFSPDPMDFAGWIEVYLEDRWYTFDPRNNIPRVGRVLIARGRDAADVAISCSFGPATLERFQVWTEETTRDASTFSGPGGPVESST